MRKSRKLNQAEFAAVFSLTPSSVSRIEGAVAVPNFDTALRLAAFFGLTPEGVMTFGGYQAEDSPIAPEVKGYLDKARKALEGPEAELFKQMIDKFG